MPEKRFEFGGMKILRAGLADQGIVSFGNFALSVSLARILPVGDYGIYSVAMSFLVFFNTLHQAFIIYPLSVHTAGTPRMYEHLLRVAVLLTLPCALPFLLVLGAGTDNSEAAVAYLALATAFVLSVEGPFWATMMEVAGARSGTAGGVLNCGGNIGGVISPALTPILAAYMGWKNALYVAAALALVGAGLWLGISPNEANQAREA